MCRSALFHFNEVVLCGGTWAADRGSDGSRRAGPAPEPGSGDLRTRPAGGTHVRPSQPADRRRRPRGLEIKRSAAGPDRRTRQICPGSAPGTRKGAPPATRYLNPIGLFVCLLASPRVSQPSCTHAASRGPGRGPAAPTRLLSPRRLSYLIKRCRSVCPDPQLTSVQGLSVL